MRVIELCGMPGCGKSTAFKAFREAYPEAAGKYKSQNDLCHKSKWQWALAKRLCGLRIRLGLLDEREKRLMELMKGDGKKLMSYRSKVLALYRRLKKYSKSDLCFILDEGLIQHVSSAFYDGKAPACEGGLPVIPWQYEAVYFYCDIGEAVRRNRQRGRKNRYNVSDEAELKRVLLTKASNIAVLLPVFCSRIRKIDTSMSKEECAKRLKEIIEEK